MNVLLFTFTLWLTTSVFTSLVAGAPLFAVPQAHGLHDAISSVHVTFVTGNKGVHYSHGSGSGFGGGGDGSISHFNALDDSGASGLNLNADHAVRNPRSVGVARRAPPTTTTTAQPGEGVGAGGVIELLKMSNKQPTAAAAAGGRGHLTTEMPTTGSTTIRSASASPRPRAASSTFARRVAFIKTDADESATATTTTTNDNEQKPVKGEARQDNHPGPTTVASASATETATLTAKDSAAKAAVKRSPQFHDNFLGNFDFPDFDDFGGNDFGHGREFEESQHEEGEPHHGGGGHGGGGRHRPHINHAPEGMAPDGVFLPPVPTQASNYVENDPYLAEPEVASYAVQHVPYFHEFPHKRTVLALNERREENGLEPNVLRSIRPFFAFFEINKRRRRR